MEINLEVGHIVLIPVEKMRGHVYTVTNHIARLPVLTAGPGALILTSDQVAEIMSSVP